MRISDWSSDVCSSDLARAGLVVFDNDRQAGFDFAVQVYADFEGANRTDRPADDIELVLFDAQAQSLGGIDDFSHTDRTVEFAFFRSQHLDLKRLEIGRASCMERVCQYV